MIDNEVGLHPDNSDLGLDGALLERSRTVLWTLAGEGIILHNFANRRFLELDRIGYQAWALLDGARTVAEVKQRCRPASREADELGSRIDEMITTLYVYGFIIERTAQ